MLAVSNLLVCVYQFYICKLCFSAGYVSLCVAWWAHHWGPLHNQSPLFPHARAAQWLALLSHSKKSCLLFEQYAEVLKWKSVFSLFIPNKKRRNKRCLFNVLKESFSLFTHSYKRQSHLKSLCNTFFNFVLYFFFLSFSKQYVGLLDSSVTKG